MSDDDPPRRSASHPPPAGKKPTEMTMELDAIADQLDIVEAPEVSMPPPLPPKKSPRGMILVAIAVVLAMAGLGLGAGYLLRGTPAPTATPPAPAAEPEAAPEEDDGEAPGGTLELEEIVVE